MKRSFLVVCLLSLLCMGWAKSDSKQTENYAYLRGVEAFNEGNIATSLEWFEREVSEHPGNGYAYFYISILRAGNGEYGKALTAIDNASKILPKKDKLWRSGALSARADIFMAMGDTVRALEDLAKAVKTDPSNSEVYKSRGQLFYELKDYDLSDTDYRKMITLDQGDVTGHMGVGRNAIARKRWDDAVSEFNYALKLMPGYANGYAFRAEAYLGKEMWAEATDDIIEALEIAGDDKAFYMMQYLPEEAAALLKTKLKIQMAKQPSNQYWPYCLGVIADKDKNYDEAISYYEKAHALDANSILLKSISQCYANKEDYDKALDYADRALAMSPDDYEIIDLKADILSELGRYDDCFAERDRYVAKYPEYYFAYLSRAEDLMKVRRFDEAAEDYTTAMTIAPVVAEWPYILMKRGDAYRFTGNKEKADKDYEALLKAEKDSTLTADSWTPFAHTGLGNADKAIETMQYILVNDTTDVTGSLYNAACVYARLGRNAESLRYLEEAIEKGYHDFRHIEADYDMDNIRETPEFASMVKNNAPVVRIPIVDASKVKDETPQTGNSFETVEIPFTKEGGVTKVKCTINGLPLHFVFDTGAADVTMSLVEASFMLKNGYIKPEDVIGSAQYMDANGDISEGTVINLRSVNFGGLELDNVRASVVRSQTAPLLLGQSVLGRLGKIEIDNPGTKLVITHRK